MLAAALAAGRAAAQPAPAPAAPAAAAPSRVVFVAAAGDDEILREAATRLRAELRAAGFEVTVADRPAVGPGGAEQPVAADDLRASMGRVARDAGAFAAASLSRVGSRAVVDLWIVDRATGKIMLHRVSGGGASAPSVVAVRAVELLQASLLEASARRGEAADGGPAPPGVERRRTPAPHPPAPAAPRPGLLEGVTVAAGAFVLQSADGVGPALGPALRLSIGPPWPVARGAFAGRLTLAGPAVAPALSGPLGEVSVRQELAALELVYALPVDGPVVPVFSVGAGAYHLRVSGAPDPPFRSAVGDVWAALASAGAGVGIRLTDRVAALAEVQLLLTEPRPVIQLDGETLGTAGRPTFASFLGILARL